MLKAVLLLAGALCVVVGAAVLSWPAGLLALGVLMVLAAVDLAGVDR
jgi:hypothetical protein